MTCCNDCKDCGCKDCGCPEPIQSIDNLDSQYPGRLRFNYGGRSVDYDFSSMIKQVETDTSLSVDSINRVLKYAAERHMDTLSAKEIGSILHIADIGDVDITGVTDNSLLVYQKDSDCGQGCEGIDNAWIAWNSNENLSENIETVMGFDADGKPHALARPQNTNQFYMLGWNAAGKVSYTQAVEVSSAPTDKDDKVYRLYVDPDSKQLVYVKENK